MLGFWCRRMATEKIVCGILIDVCQVRREKGNDRLANKKNCHSDLDLTWTFLLSVQRVNNSSILFTQYFQEHASIHLNLIVHNSSSSSVLQFDLWLPNNRARLRAQLREFPYETPLFINVIYRAPSSLAVLLFGQMMDSTTEPISSPSDQTPNKASLAVYTFVRFQSISWSYDQTPSGRYFFSFSRLYFSRLLNCRRLLCIFARRQTFKTRFKRSRNLPM